jgi:hypothetical protein
MADALRQAAIGWPAPPICLRASEEPFWHSVMIARLPVQWARVDLLHAANLARCLADIESNRAALLHEGTLIRTAAGPKINPRHALVETLTRRSIALTRMLQLHAVVTVGPVGKGAGSSKGEAGNAAAALGPAPTQHKRRGGFDADDLLAKPRLQ